jgi:hypothetical protein
MIALVARKTLKPIPGLPQSLGAIHAEDNEGRLFFAKSQFCKKSKGINPSWLANELFYYVIATRSGLRMPFASILEVDGQPYWDSEYKVGRDSLFEIAKHSKSKPEHLLRDACKGSRDQLASLMRCLLLDVALLNSDRTTWNILANRSGAPTELWYVDHDKCLLGDALEANHVPAGDLGRVDPVWATLDTKVKDYLACPTANDLILDSITDQEAREIFLSLDLSSGAVASADTNCPSNWRSAILRRRQDQFLSTWWPFLRGRILGADPMDFLRKNCTRLHRPN